MKLPAIVAVTAAGKARAGGEGVGENIFLSVLQLPDNQGEIFRPVNPKPLVVGQNDVDADACFQKAQLFQFFYLLQRAWRQGGEGLKGGKTVGI
jgi:hypothetical protein